MRMYFLRPPILWISLLAQAMVAANRDVIPPTMATTFIAIGERLNMALHRATMKTPAVTIVAAWMRALTGVGPSIASGNHTWRGICADFPTAPQKRSKAINVAKLTSYPRRLMVWPAMFLTWAKTGT